MSSSKYFVELYMGRPVEVCIEVFKDVCLIFFFFFFDVEVVIELATSIDVAQASQVNIPNSTRKHNPPKRWGQKGHQ